MASPNSAVGLLSVLEFRSSSITPLSVSTSSLVSVRLVILSASSSIIFFSCFGGMR